MAPELHRCGEHLDYIGGHMPWECVVCGLRFCAVDFEPGGRLSHDDPGTAAAGDAQTVGQVEGDGPDVGESSAYPPDEGVAPDSPRGLLQRALFSTLTDPARALDRLQAVDQLARLVSEWEQQAVIGARQAGCTWAQMGAAVGGSRSYAVGRWAEQVRPFERAGLLEPEPLPPPVEPVGPPASTTLGDARQWCRWCGHRIVWAGSGRQRGWAHHHSERGASSGDLIEVDCPGPEPWPKGED